MDHDARVLQAGLGYIKRGLAIVLVYGIHPVTGFCTCTKGEHCANAGKHPIGTTTKLDAKGKDAATWAGGIRDEVTFRREHKKFVSGERYPNLGIATGGDIIAIDDDDYKPDYKGGIEAEFGIEMPATLEGRSGGGGRVRFYRLPPGVEIKNSAGGVATAVDVRGEGGQSVVAPSLHSSGKRYAWCDNPDADIAAAPDDLIKHIRISSKPGRRRRAAAATPPAGIIAHDPSYRIPDVFPAEGGRNTSLISLGGKFRSMGFNADEIEDFLTIVNERPERMPNPLPSNEIRTISNSAGKYATDNDLPLAVGDGPTRSKSRPILDPAALYGLPGDIARAIEPNSEADSAAILAQTLVVFGNVVGRSACFVVEADTHHLNLNTVIVGDSSRGRKGTSYGHVEKLFKGLDHHFEQRKIKGLSSGEGLIEHVGDHSGRDKRSLIIASEFAEVLRVQKREGNTLSTTLRDAWDSGFLNVTRRNNPGVATNVHISLIGHVTSIELRKCLSEVDSTNGFSNRILWIHSERSKKLPRGGMVDPAVMGKLVERLSKAVDFARGEVTEMDLDDEAWELWAEFYNSIDDGDAEGGGVATTLDRAEAQTRRLACVYALMDQSDTVRTEHLAAAIAFWNYAADSARHIFGGGATGKTESKILEALRESGESGLTKTEIYRDTFRRNEKSTVISGALDRLLKSGNVRFELEDTGGVRATQRWHIKLN